MQDPTTGGGRWRLFAGLVLLAAVMALSLTIWFVSRDDGAALLATQEAVPIVRAPDGPDRVRPEDPGGEQVPDQDKQVFETFQPAEARDKPVVERLLPEAEQPMPEPEPEPVARTAPAPEPEARPEAAPETQVVVVQPENDAVSKIVIKQRPAPVPPPEPAPKVAAASDGIAWRVQLAALRDEDAAEKTWQRISGRQKSLLKNLQPSISRVDTQNKGTFYRLRVGAFASKAEAEALCARLKKAGQDCLVAKG